MSSRKMPEAVEMDRSSKATIMSLLLPLYFIISISLISSVRSDYDEHVVLANCEDQARVKSSQMAYWRGPTNHTPSAVVTIVTNRTLVWEGSDLVSGTFADGVTFVANISANVAAGSYAGTGKNDYGPFSCWSNYTQNLYTWENTTCDQITIATTGTHPPRHRRHPQYHRARQHSYKNPLQRVVG